VISAVWALQIKSQDWGAGEGWDLGNLKSYSHGRSALSLLICC